VGGDVGERCSQVKEIFIPVLVVGHRQRLALADSHSTRYGTLAALAVGFPERRIGPPDLEQHILDQQQRQVVGEEFHRQDDDVDVVEEIQIDMGDWNSSGGGWWSS
jgi:hypothetical protein